MIVVWLLLGIGLGVVLAFLLGVVLMFLVAHTDAMLDVEYPVRLVPNGPIVRRRDCPFGSFFDGEKIRFNLDLSPEADAYLCANDPRYERIDEDVLVQPLMLRIVRQAVTRDVKAPDSWVDKFRADVEAIS